MLNLPRRRVHVERASANLVRQVANLRPIVNPPSARRGAFFGLRRCRSVGQPILAVLMGLRPTKWDENLALAVSSAEGESRVHLISVGAFPVEVEAAVEILRPSGCLIRNLHLNQ